MSKKSKRDAEFAEQLRIVLRECRTYGQLEAAAGVTDRVAFWRGKNEDQAREELHRLIAERLRASNVKERS